MVRHTDLTLTYLLVPGTSYRLNPYFSAGPWYVIQIEPLLFCWSLGRHTDLTLTSLLVLELSVVRHTH